METDEASAATGSTSGAVGAGAPPGPAPSPLPELEMFATLLVVMYLLDQQHVQQVGARPGCGWLRASHGHVGVHGEDARQCCGHGAGHMPIRECTKPDCCWPCTPSTSHR
jgi:hypothetical protein